MKIIYLYPGAGLKPGSVQKKIIEQIKAFNTINVECKGLFFTTEKVDNNQSDQYTFIRVPRLDKGTAFRSIRQRRIYQKSILEYFQKENPAFDYLYIRYPGANSFLLKFSKRYSKKFFLEHVTMETEEIKLYKAENPLRYNVSSWIGNIEYNFVPRLQEYLYGKKIRRNALFGICNSVEIADFENKIEGGRYNTMISGDAVNVASFELKPRPALDKEFRMIFLKGASTNADFNGLDRIFNGIRNYKGDYTLRFFIYGGNTTSERETVKRLKLEDFVIIQDHIDQATARQVMDNIHLGIGAFGIHRKGFASTTTIKTREYTAQGIPFIYGHQDPDFSGHAEAQLFSLEFPANDEWIDFEKVIGWYQDTIKDQDYLAKMGHFALHKLDYSVKMDRIRQQLEKLSA